MAASKAVISRMRAVRTSQRADKSSRASTQNFIESLPSEILMTILSYLDASALFSIGHVNKLFHYLADDNALWNKIYIQRFFKNKKTTLDELMVTMATTEVQEQAAGYWRRQFFKGLAAHDMKNWKRHLKVINPYTGLPSHTEQVLRNLRITWELTVFDKSGHEHTLKLSWSRFFETSITVCGSIKGFLPTYQQISSLQLHGVWRVALNSPGLKSPGRRSLMLKSDMQILTKDTKVIGQDRLVELKLLQPGVIIGFWKGQCSVAFVMFTLHFHRLVERSLEGSPDCPYMEPIVKAPFDDIDPEYGLHGYQLHIVLQNTVCEFMSGSFSQLFCRKAQVCDGLIQLTAISRTNLSQHRPLTGNITLPWRCEALQGTVENCCIMTLTLLDEFRKPFWCISSPVSVAPQKTPVYYDYDGEHYVINYQDSDGQVIMELVRMEERKQLVLVSLDVYVATHKVNKHFSKNY